MARKSNKPQSIVGQKFGKIEVCSYFVEYEELPYGNLKLASKMFANPENYIVNGTLEDAEFLCKCDCGRTFYTRGRHLISGKKRSCGRCKEAEKTNKKGKKK